MLSLLDHGATLCDGITRREWMRIGGIGPGGLTMPGLAAARAATPTSIAPTAKRVILFGLTGGGIRGGVVHGSSDRHAAFPIDGVVRPRDIISTVFHCLGYEPETVVHDPLDRPIPISRGRVIHEIL